MDHYWYVERPDELFIDSDGRGKGTPADMAIAHLSKYEERKPPPLHKLKLSLDRLNGAILAGLLPTRLAYCYLYPSSNPHHYHLMIQLTEAISHFDKLRWKCRLMDDPYRMIQDAARYELGITGSLLISPVVRQDYPRAEDHYCDCSAKHSAEVIKACPVAYELRGPHSAADYYGAPTPIEWPKKYGRIG